MGVFSKAYNHITGLGKIGMMAREANPYLHWGLIGGSTVGEVGTYLHDRGEGKGRLRSLAGAMGTGLAIGAGSTLGLGAYTRYGSAGRQMARNMARPGVARMYGGMLKNKGWI